MCSGLCLLRSFVALADGVDSQYAKFEDWREKADNTNDKLVGFENRVKNEGKLATKFLSSSCSWRITR